MASHPNNIALALAFALSLASAACGSSAGSVESGAEGGASGSAIGGGNSAGSEASAGAAGSSVTPQGGAAGGALAGAGGSGGSAGNDTVTAGTGGLSAGGSAGTAGSGGTGTGGNASGGSAGGGSSANGGSAGASGGSAGTGGSASPVTFPAQCTCMTLGPPSCAATGHVTYTLVKAAAPTAAQQKAYDSITCAMQGAIAYYDCYTSITKQLSVTYNTDVATADGNYNGAIRFGGSQYMECVTAMHEIAHSVGVGTAPKWPTYSVGGVFTGTTATAQLRKITGNPADVLHSDTQHFWPYGLNYTSEATSTKDLIDHCEMVTAIRKDLGLQ